MIVITHYQRLLEYIQPDFVHVLVDGRIVRSGDKQLALDLEKHGYGWLEEYAGEKLTETLAHISHHLPTADAEMLP